jgi:D-alanine-D-alanine ligase-like ATP-grasp enzyme
LTGSGDTPGASRRAIAYELLERYCAVRGFRLTAGDAHGHAGCVESPAGRRWYFKGTRFDLNTLGASEIANDKAYAAAFLQRAGIAVPAGHLVFSSEIRDARRPPKAVLDFAGEHGFPLFVKPNCGREGRDVMRVDTRHTLHNALHLLAKRNEQMLVQEEVRGTELRVLVLDGEILAAIERRPPQVTGDGIRSLAEIIGADPRINAADPRLDFQLSQQHLMLETVPAAGQAVTLLPVANLSVGGTARIVTESLPEILADHARNAARTLSLRYAAVDLILPETPGADAAAVVLEVNAAPGLGNLYRQGPDEAQVVEEVYERVFAAMFG